MYVLYVLGLNYVISLSASFQIQWLGKPPCARCRLFRDAFRFRKRWLQYLTHA